MIQTNTCTWRAAVAGAALTLTMTLSAAPLLAEAFDPAKYMPVSELRSGMKGFGRTVLAGTEIVTFDAEVISVMHNAFNAKQDVILVRCKGMGLEHSGIIAGMSGSPVYITDDKGQNPRMIGAVAYGWTFNKDPICGVQPIYQMLAIQGVSTTQPATDRSSASARDRIPGGTPGVSGEASSRSSPRRRLQTLEPLSKGRFSTLFSAGPEMTAAAETGPAPDVAGLQPLATPIMVTGASRQTLGFLREGLEGSGFEPVLSGGFGGPDAGEKARLEPGSVFCVPLMQGDMQMTALGTCTDVIGEKALAFGHAFFADGEVELPMAAGAVHTVIPSVMRSIKIGTALNTVGTLVADEQTGIFGKVGPAPAMVPCEVLVRHPNRTDEFHYDCIQQPFFTPLLFSETVLNSVSDHANLPKEHTLRYSIEVAFKDLGVFRSSNITSQGGELPIAMEVSAPARALMNNQFGKAKADRVKVEISVEPVARLGTIERAEIARDCVKPGATLEVFVWWRQFRAPTLTKSYTFKLPDDIPEGSYDLTVCSSEEHVRALRAERPYFFRVESMKQMLEAMNFLAKFQDDRLYLRLSLPTGGMSLGRDNLPDLPSFRRRILADSKRTDVARYTDALVEASR
jgi:hypothetical protein